MYYVMFSFGSSFDHDKNACATHVGLHIFRLWGSQWCSSLAPRLKPCRVGFMSTHVVNRVNPIISLQYPPIFCGWKNIHNSPGNGMVHLDATQQRKSKRHIHTHRHPTSKCEVKLQVRILRESNVNKRDMGTALACNSHPNPFRKANNYATPAILVGT